MSQLRPGERRILPFNLFVNWRHLQAQELTPAMELLIEEFISKKPEDVSPISVEVTSSGRIWGALEPGHSRWEEVVAAHEVGWHGFPCQGVLAKDTGPLLKKKLQGLYDDGRMGEGLREMAQDYWERPVGRPPAVAPAPGRGRAR